jgi:hypothetical protein
MIKLYKTPTGEKSIEHFHPQQGVSIRGSLPKILYKYRDWDSSYNKRMLTDLEIWLSSPAEFNDPFDCKIPNDYEVLKDEHIRREYYTKIINGLAKQGLPYSKQSPGETIIETIESRVKNHNFEQFNNEAANLRWSEYINEHGLYCTTPINDNILMWAHYAKNSTGFCIGLNTEELLKSSTVFEACVQIKYIETADIPKVHPLLEFIPTFEQTCCAKFSIWSYEHEYRFVSLSPEHRLVSLLPKHISSIILGSAMTQTNREEIKQILSKERFNHVKLFQAKQSSTRFELDIVEISKA